VDGRAAGGDGAGGDGVDERGVGGGAVQLEPVAADKRVHIAFVDGLRGVAALYVVLGHVYAYTRVWAEPLLPKPVHALLKFIDQGHSAVAVFIVISGFCLMMPLSRRQLGTPQGGTGRFLQKRARRILPPYYAALVLSILLVAVVGSIRSAQDLGAKSIGFHALLVHNLDRTTMFTINGPLWSVVLECQIYVLFALVLLPVYRRYGFPALLGAAFAFGLVPFAVLPSAWDLGWTFPWYLGLFGLGCLASHIVFSPAPAYARARAWRGWAPASAVSIAVVVLVVGFVLGPALRQLWAFDTLVGIAAALLIVHLALSSLARDESARPPTLLRFLASRRMVALGLFSYSLYLIHEPILRVLAVWLHQAVASPVLVMVLEAVIGVPLVVAVAFAFSLVFERPFQSSSKPAVPAGSSGH
jgi:peptidoglycan/LPS O-acetylase OafA/YrhL